MVVICPKVPSELKLSGGPKLGWLKKLKNWNPIPSTADGKEKHPDDAVVCGR